MQSIIQKTPSDALLLCVCSGNAFLGDLGISRSMEYDFCLSCQFVLGILLEHDFLSVLSIYPRILLSMFIVYRLLLGIIFQSSSADELKFTCASALN